MQLGVIKLQTNYTQTFGVWETTNQIEIVLFLLPSICVYVCVYVFMCVWVQVHMCTCRLLDNLRYLSCLRYWELFELESLTESRTSQVGQSGSPTMPGLHHSLPPQCWVYMCAPSNLIFFSHGFRGFNSGSYAFKAYSILTEPSPQSLCAF